MRDITDDRSAFPSQEYNNDGWEQEVATYMVDHPNPSQGSQNSGGYDDAGLAALLQDMQI